MRIRTAEELRRRLESDPEWRIKELDSLKKAIDSSTEENRKAHLRAGVLLLCAHWEEFVKNAAENYLRFVAAKGLNCDELSHPFIAMALRGEMAKDKATVKASAFYVKTVEFMLEGLSNQAKIPYRDIIKTEDNLKSEVLKAILITIGIDYSPYELQSNIIDSQLLRIRNAVAHGQGMNVDRDEFNCLNHKIIELIDD
ncbi:MAE_28990/MAE_18760 family HEPN-like nuclease [Desulfobacterales bacterium HSG2]|nr:MAE_28990/MAE_18760 family HEPN-like nuclease [Desulfobacterales bacterium HSG2]